MLRWQRACVLYAMHGCAHHSMSASQHGTNLHCIIIIIIYYYYYYY